MEGQLNIEIVLHPDVSLDRPSHGISFCSRFTRYHVEVAESQVLECLGRLASGHVKQENILELKERNRIVLRHVISEMFGLGLLQYRICREGTDYVIARSLRPLRQFTQSTQLRRQFPPLRSGVVILHEGDGRFLVVEPYSEAQVSISSRSLESLFSDRGEGGAPAEFRMSLMSLLAGLGFLQETTVVGGRAAAPLAPHEQLFHCLSRLDEHVSSKRDVNNLRSRYEWELSETRQKAASVPEYIKQRRSRRMHERVELLAEDVRNFFSVLLSEQSSDGGVRRRSYPAAGGIDDYSFFLLINRCTGLEEGLYQVKATERGTNVSFVKLEVPRRSVEAAQAEAALAWGRPAHYPHSVVFVTTDNKGLGEKYGPRAYRLALLTGGAMLATMYLVAEELGMKGCALGSGSRILETMVRQFDARQCLLAEFALGGVAAR